MKMDLLRLEILILINYAESAQLFKITVKRELRCNLQRAQEESIWKCIITNTGILRSRYHLIRNAPIT